MQEWRLHPTYRISWYLPLLWASFLGVLALTPLGSTRTGALALLTGVLIELAQALRVHRRQSRLRVILTGTEVINVSPVGEDRIRLADISGVVVTKRGLARDTWSTWLLTSSGGALRLTAPAYVFLSRHRALVRPDHSYWAAVANSASGQQAAAIYAAAHLCRTEHGPLATAANSVAEQLASHGSLRSALQRFWSPNGETSNPAP